MGLASTSTPSPPMAATAAGLPYSTNHSNGEEKRDGPAKTNNNSSMNLLVDDLLLQMEHRFADMGRSILGRMDEMGTRMDELEQSIASLLVVQQQQQPKDRRVPVGIEATADVFGEIRPQAAASPLSRSLPPSTAAAPRGGTMALPKINNPNPKKNMVSISAAHPVIAKASSSLYARGNNTNNTLHAMARATAPHQQQHRKSSPNVIANNTTKSSSTGSSNIHLLETRNPPTTGTATTTLQSPSPSPSSSFAKQNSLTVAEFPRFATSIEI